MVDKGLIKPMCQLNYMVDDVSVPPSNLVSSVTSSASDLHMSIESWCQEGFRHFDDVMLNLAKSNLITDPMMKTLLFNIFGQYVHGFTMAFQMNNDIIASSSIAFSNLIQDPQVSNLVQGFMTDAINDKIQDVI